MSNKNSHIISYPCLLQCMCETMRTAMSKNRPACTFNVCGSSLYMLVFHVLLHDARLVADCVTIILHALERMPWSKPQGHISGTASVRHQASSVPAGNSP